jgi:hypothetical protein
MNASREQPLHVCKSFRLARAAFCWPSIRLSESPPLSLPQPHLSLIHPSFCHGHQPRASVDERAAKRWRGALVCPSRTQSSIQNAAGIPWNVAANATLCLSPVQVSWIGHSRDRSVPPGRPARPREMPNVAWKHPLGLHFVRWIRPTCPLLPTSFPMPPRLGLALSSRDGYLY